MTLNSRDKPNLYFKTEINLITSIIGKEDKYSIDFSNLGTISYKEIESDSIKIQVSNNFINLVGIDFFKKDILVIDGINNKFYYSDILKHRPNQNNKLGLRFGIRNEKIFITAIIKDSLSYKKGIKLGDAIESINENKIKIPENTLDSINNIRNNIKNITIKRNDELLQFSF